eukprot:218409_1
MMSTVVNQTSAPVYSSNPIEYFKFVRVQQCGGHNEGKRINAVAWNQDGYYFASASSDKSCRIMKCSATGLQTSKTCRELVGHTQTVEDLSWNPTQNDELVSASEDKTIRVWDIRAATKCTKSINTDDTNTNVDWSPNGRFIAVRRGIEKLRWFLKNDPKFSHLQKINEALKMPVRPDLSVSGIIPEKASMFKSALSPLNLTFQTLDPSSMYKVIFKSGDDLSQDQMIINIIKLMDRLLKRVNLDLKLTPYNVLATSENDGFVDFVPESFTITSILEKFDNSIIEFLKFYNDTPTAFGDSLDSFVKSCAGYCVITYLLAIGDRHLDNLLVTKSGRLFHIDFGFVFGNDPKPFPPPMKLCKEMVEAMGQSDSVHYHKFEIYCCQAFNILRKSAILILNLLSLMGDSSSEFSMAMKLVQHNFRLDLSDEEAEQFFLMLISESVNAMFPKVFEKIHKWALYWR